MTNYRAILLYYSKGNTTTQIATICDCSRTTVIRAVKRAKAINLSLPVSDKIKDEDGAVAGYVMIGQFIDEQEREAVYRSAREAVGDVPELRREVDALRALRSDEVASLAYLMAVCAEYLCFSEALTAGRSRKLAGVDAYIRENMKGPLSVSVLAQALGMSRTALYYLIKGESGRSVTDYVNFQRIERAKELLHENAGTEEILSETGMTDANYFGRLFRRYAGCTLRDYRKGVRSGER